MCLGGTEAEGQRQRQEPICLGVIGNEVQGPPFRVWHIHGDANMRGRSGRPECRSIPAWSAEGQKVGGLGLLSGRYVWSCSCHHHEATVGAAGRNHVPMV